MVTGYMRIRKVLFVINRNNELLKLGFKIFGFFAIMVAYEEGKAVLETSWSDFFRDRNR